MAPSRSDAAIFPADALGRERGHFADGFGQREPMLFADVDAENARERSGSARMASRCRHRWRP